MEITKILNCAKRHRNGHLFSILQFQLIMYFENMFGHSNQFFFTDHATRMSQYYSKVSQNMQIDLKTYHFLLISKSNLWYTVMCLFTVQ